MKSLENLFCKMLTDLGEYCCATTTRDILYVSRRFREEGESFLTITLPAYADDFERSLSLGRIPDSAFRSFGKHGVIPKFLSGILLQVFSAKGDLLPSPSVAAIFAIRQFCRFAKKQKKLPSDKKTLLCYKKFLDNEQFMRSGAYRKCPDDYRNMFLQVSRLLWTRLDSLEFHPSRPGPGAVAERLLPNKKWEFTYWHTRLERIFPYSGHAVYRPDLVLDRDYHELSPAQELPVRVISVPKTQKGPRIIAIEPQVMQFAQQGICRSLMDYLEKTYPFKGHVNFSDQTINGKLALASSKTGKFATIDLSDASDLVSAKLVRDMLTTCPNFKDAVFAVRSTRADVPGFGVIPLQKYASMGSALCFPIESMVFFTIALTNEIMRGAVRLSDISTNDFRANIWVYGDDIIVPVESASSLINTLTNFGLRVNSAKSFWTGKFRESCGVDAYDGIAITPAYLRVELPTKKSQVDAIVSLVATANQLHDNGFFHTSSWIQTYIRKLVKIPTSATSDASYIAFTFGPEVGLKQRWNPYLQRIEVKTLCVETKARPDPLNEEQAILRYFVNGMSRNEKSYRESVSPGSLAYKTRWCAKV